ncbi:MAG: GNAT family N-acetyltransferase [Nocardioidaceae bacterium]
MLPDLLTARLQLASVKADDLDLMRVLNADEAVMRNLTGRPAGTEEAHAEWRERLHERSNQKRGLGYWNGRSDGEFVGWWGLGVCSGDQTHQHQCFNSGTTVSDSPVAVRGGGECGPPGPPEEKERS